MPGIYLWTVHGIKGGMAAFFLVGMAGFEPATSRPPV